MSKIDYQALRAKAEKATPDEWVAFISTDTGTYAVHTPGDERCEDVIKWTGFDGQKNAENNARYVAAFNPKVTLELLGEIKRLEDTNIDAMCRIAELETNLAALAAENELARKAVQAFCDVVGDNTEVIAEVVGRDGVLVILEAMKATGNMPATDAFLAEVRAQGVDAAIEAAKNLVAQEYEYKDFKAAQSDCCMHPGSDLVGKVEMTEWLVDFAAQLRKGGNQ
ncbi:ead/Ea22-like family protein [Salmonella enterica]|nr:ead/Ea22-like family protein [Salmonella enterica]EDL0870843.1 ead/Ea22-like family protein [Salmonella enterica subsp. enterica serovar Heidelberg]EDM8523275.1 ead/Ea22-like family protein [Salmonella enterica subsp. enterica serovar Heidelberg]